MIEIVIVLVNLYAGYRLFRKEGETFFYEKESHDYITHNSPTDGLNGSR